MLLPKNVSTTCCQEAVNNILVKSELNSNTDSISDLTKESFGDNPDYNIVFKNFNYNTRYEAWIYEGNEEDKIVGYKMFQSYPYSEPKFKIGDYIHWNYDHKQLSTWLLTSLDTQYLYNVKGRMLLCNNSLRWKDTEGELNCFPCVIKDAMTYTNFKWGNSGIVESGGDIVVLVQRNVFTSKVEINDRFIFTGVAFKVKQKFNELNPDYLELYMMKVPELEGDDLENNIAINERPITSVKKNVVIEPNISEILQGNTQDFSVYNYIDGIANSDVFDISIEDVPQDNYELNIKDGNNFSITNKKQYTKNQLKIICKNNIDNSITSKQIWLGGNW